MRYAAAIGLIVLLAGAKVRAEAQAADKPGYAQVQAVIAKHCLSCHDAKEAEGELVMESFASLMKGGDKGPVILPGRADQSLLVQLIEQKKKPFMPPRKARDTLKESEITLIRAWVAGGAPGPAAGREIAALPPLIKTPDVRPLVAPRKPVRAIAYLPQGNFAAIAKDSQVQIISVATRDVIRTLHAQNGNVNAMAFSADGSKLAAGAGAPGLSGEIDLWNPLDGTLLKQFSGHKDAVYSVALSPDGRILASGSYDNSIILWDVSSGKPLRTLAGHNGAVLGLAFRADGAVLASASADRTVKLWDVKTRDRLDTFAESLKELNCVLFTPDGRVIAGGGDNRIRIWQVSPSAKEGTNRLLVAQFGHEGSILHLALSSDGKTIASSADDRTVKLWDSRPDSSSGSPELKLLRALPRQPDWPAVVAFAGGDKLLLVGRLDGSVGFYNPATARPILPPRPELASVEPRGIQRGQTIKLKLKGRHLADLTAAVLGDRGITANVVDANDDQSDSVWLQVVCAADVTPGPYELRVRGPGGQSGAVKLFVDDLPQVSETLRSESPQGASIAALPADLWGAFDQRGEIDYFAFDAHAGQQIVIDAATRRLGSKAKLLIELLDPAGRLIASGSGFDNDPEPLLAFTAPSDGRYLIRASELEAAASNEHFYRLSVGSFSCVSGVYPLAVAPNSTTRIQLLGVNCPTDAWASVKSGAAGGEAQVPVDWSKFRARGPLSVLIGPGPEPVEQEPNDQPGQAMPIAVGGAVNGRIDHPGDVDLYRFDARAGRNYVVETLASRRGSPVDTRIEILHPDGSPVPRVQLRAVRNSSITFRPIDANAGGARLVNWQEMDLNQYLYMNGEVVRLFLAPRGPDSEYNFYTIAGRRRCYFGTTATAHALDEPCYIVEPHPPGETLPPNGLPVFTINYANDDDSQRKLGSDSRLLFAAPADGAYLVKVTDARGFGGDRYAYRLTVRPAMPDFAVSTDLMNPSVPPGSGRKFTVSVDRIDGFDGPVRVDIAGAPPGFVVSTPIIVEAGHTEAAGTLFASADAPRPTAANDSRMKITAAADINGAKVTRQVNAPGKISLAAKPPLFVDLMSPGGPATRGSPDSAQPEEITVVPGQFTPARLSIERNGFKDEVTFEVDNLPHGVIVADIGLNGVLIVQGQSQRQIFFHTAPWVADTDRLCFARAADGATSRPVLIHVRRAVTAKR